jgi:hypothetical protein
VPLVSAGEQTGDSPATAVDLSEKSGVSKEEGAGSDIGLGHHVDVDGRAVDQTIHPDSQVGIDAHLDITHPIPPEGECCRRAGIVADEIVLEQQGGCGEQLGGVVIDNGGIRIDDAGGTGSQAHDLQRCEERLELSHVSTRFPHRHLGAQSVDERRIVDGVDRSLRRPAPSRPQRQGDKAAGQPAWQLR